MANRLRLPPRMVGVHPANRNGFGVSAIEVHALGEGIVKQGWLPSATAHAVCVEASGSDVADYTANLVKSNVGLGPVDNKACAYGSLSCSHTNQFLHAVNSEVSTIYEELAVDGRFSPGKLGKDKLLADVLKNGLDWLVLSKEVPKLYPSLLDLVQWAKNAPGALQRKENEIQILLKIQSLARASSASASSVVDWAAIGNMISKRNNVEAHELTIEMETNIRHKYKRT